MKRSFTDNLTFLDDDQIFEYNKLEIFRKYGIIAAITDFSILLGGVVGTTLKDRIGYWWTKSRFQYVIAVVGINNKCFTYSNSRVIGVRPVVSYSYISKFASNRVVKNDIEEVEFGEYPQTIVSEEYSKELESLYSQNELKQTGKKYTTDSVYYEECNNRFQPRTHIEYEYKGSKYIRFIADKNGEDKLLSDGRKVEINKPYWLKVEPITWLVDKKSGIALCKKIIFSGIRFNIAYNISNFKDTEIKHFMDNYFSKEILPLKLDNIYLLNYTLSNGKVSKYYGAYEKDGILRDINTDIMLVQEDASFIPENTLAYHFKKEALTSEILDKCISKKDTIRYLKYIRELYSIKRNTKTHRELLKELSKEKIDSILKLKKK